jgi:ABC-type sugar transport system ATPase subunit
MISSEMQEVLQLSDRVYVMCEGRVTAELGRDELSGPAIMTAATAAGGGKEAAV